MAACKIERRQKNVKFGLSKDDSYGVDCGQPHEGNSFNSTRDYWQGMVRGGIAEIAVVTKKQVG